MRQARTLVRLASGAALHVAGPGGAAPIVFLHGVAGGAWSWQPQFDECSDGQRCYAFEARGHGAARPVSDAGLGDYYADALEALDGVNERDGPPWLVGHSMGGLLALRLAAEHPARVRGLALVDPVYAPNGTRHLGGAFAGVAGVVLRPMVADVVRNGVVARALSRWVFASSFRDRACMERAWRHQQTQVPAEYPKMIYEAFEGVSGFPNRAFARDVTQPTLLIEPLEKPGARFPQLVAELGRLGERFTHLALDGGHYLQLDRSAGDVTRALRGFVSRWSP